MVAESLRQWPSITKTPGFESLLRSLVEARAEQDHHADSASGALYRIPDGNLSGRILGWDSAVEYDADRGALCVIELPRVDGNGTVELSIVFQDETMATIDRRNSHRWVYAAAFALRDLLN